MRISLELVPREMQALHHELKSVTSDFPWLNTVNIPDLLRYELRSWDACAGVQGMVPHTIPHIRAIDINPDKALPMVGLMRESEINEVIIVAGDPPQDMARRVYHTTTTEVIRMFKEQLPGVKVYAAIDPYRTSMTNELRYAEQKLRAGADGFFTQPFFDMRLLGMYHDMLDGMKVFWGLAPVMSEKSKSYWETKNHVVFPKSFSPSLDWNTRFARDVMERLELDGGNLYFMPIRADILQYLHGIFRGTAL